MFKKGDTLIEVTLAVGIFSMIAIAVASLMNHGTADAQLALETTLTREEIDAQADALRYIHNAYVANKESESQPSTALWKTITSNAIDITKIADSEKDLVTKYTPASCSLNDVMKSNFVKNSAFILNVRNLESGTGAYKKLGGFNEASTYPRLIFSDSENGLIEKFGSKNLTRAEGLYIIAVKDPGSTSIIGEGKESAYYDFYIRSCWYGAGEETPSTISTVIRLHDASVIKDIVATKKSYDVKAKDEKIATITSSMSGPRDYRLTNAGGAWVGYVCQYKSDTEKSFVGPILVSDINGAAVSYTSTWNNGTTDVSNGSFEIDGKTYFYGSHERWMEVPSCDSAIDTISSDAKGYKKVITISNTSGKTTTERAAKELLKAKKIIK